jgi:mannose-6-phosphate isomerase-like protein (cupin superfamily)
MNHNNAVELALLQPFRFHTNILSIHATTHMTGSYALIEMQHVANAGPALHRHARGMEIMLVLGGSYTITRGRETIVIEPGDSVVIPPHIPHRYVSGDQGGHAYVITPPDLEHYFWEVAQHVQYAPLSLEEEYAIAAQYGQEFLEQDGHWQNQPVVFERAYTTVARRIREYAPSIARIG